MGNGKSNERNEDERSTDSEWLTFPDEPRLELDSALTHIAELATSVQRAQGRLRALLRATDAINTDLRLPLVLHQVAEAARELVGARYAALGVIGPKGELEQFVHVGMDGETAKRIGHLPRGAGVLGKLIRSPRALRLDNLEDDPSSVGFPSGHPPMTSFLGVPIRVRGQVYGNLYLTDSSTGTFTAEDEQLVVALSRSAGVAIENARLYEHAERQRAWLEASARAMQKLFAREAEPPLDIVLGQALVASDADMAGIVLNTQDAGWTVTASLGAESALPGSIVDLETSLAGRAITTRAAVLVDDFETTVGAAAPAASTIGSAIAVPLLDATNEAFGALSLARSKDRPGFTNEDLEQLVGFAGYVGVAIELDQARTDREAARVSNDRGRIAADLHDHVIQALFATGMNLQSVAGLIAPPEARSRVLESVDELDATIRQIRSTIFQLRDPAVRRSPLHHRLMQIVDEHSASLGFEPSVRLSGPLHLVDQDDGLVEDVLAVAREALANVTRHANASKAVLEISVEESSVSVLVMDDGDGLGRGRPTSGLVNLKHRAQSRSGRFDVSSGDGGGTKLVWSVSLPPSVSA